MIELKTHMLPENLRQVAKKAVENGLGPRGQIEEVRSAAGSRRIGYLPHQGERERARRLKRLGLSA